MMQFFAEIADKMPTLAKMWGTAASISFIVAVIARQHRRAAVALLVIAMPVSLLFALGAIIEAFFDGRTSPSVLREMSSAWIISSIITPDVPSAVGLAVLMTHLGRRTKKTRGFEPIIDPNARRHP